MSSAAVILPFVWASAPASAEIDPARRKGPASVSPIGTEVGALAAMARPRSGFRRPIDLEVAPQVVYVAPRQRIADAEPEPPEHSPDCLSDYPPDLARPQVAFYRKYTEGLLRRYLRVSLETGKVPALIGREMFRGKVTSYHVESFEDAVIFVRDVEKCLGRLGERLGEVIDLLAFKEYTVEEAAGLLCWSPKRVVRRYREALDRLTEVFLELRMLDPQKTQQKRLSRGESGLGDDK